MRKIVTIAAFLGAIASLATGAAAKQPVAVGTLPQGSLGYAIASAIAKIATEYSDLEVRAVGLGGSSVYIPQINSGEMEFGTSNTFEAIFATTGTGNFRKRANPHLRIAATLVPFAVGFMVKRDSPIKKITDLKGRPFPVGYVRMKLVAIMQDTIFKAVGMSGSDLDPVPVPNFVKGADLLAQGKVAGVLLAPGSGIVARTNAKTPIRFLGIPDTPDVKAAIQKGLPGTHLTLVKPNPRLPGIIQPVYLVGYQYVLVTGDQVPDDVVYKMVKALHDNKKALAATHGIFHRFDPNKMAVPLPGAKYHPGAIKYYKKIGMWPPKS